MIKGSVTLSGPAFVASVKWAARFLDSRPTVPIQGGLLLSVDGGTLSIVGHNETASARASVEISGGGGAGQVVVSGRLLAELAATFPNKPVEIEGVDDNAVSVRVGSWSGTLPAMSTSDFPSPPAGPDSVLGTVAGDDLAGMIRRVATARADNPDAALRWHLLHLSFGAGLVTAMATNSHRAARETARLDGAGKGTALLNAAAVLDAAESFAGPDPVHIGLTPNVIGFASPTRAVVLKQTIDADYPATQIRGLFAGEHSLHVRVTVKDLHAPMKRAQIMKEREKLAPIAVRFSQDMITILAESTNDQRSGGEEVPADYSGPEWTLKFRPAYFVDALASAPGEVVDIMLTTERITAVVMTVPGNEQWRHLLMPIAK